MSAGSPLPAKETAPSGARFDSSTVRSSERKAVVGTAPASKAGGSPSVNEVRALCAPGFRSSSPAWAGRPLEAGWCRYKRGTWFDSTGLRVRKRVASISKRQEGCVKCNEVCPILRFRAKVGESRTRKGVTTTSRDAAADTQAAGLSDSIACDKALRWTCLCCRGSQMTHEKAAWARSKSCRYGSAPSSRPLCHRGVSRNF